MTNAVTIDGPALDEVADDAVGLIRGFGAVPMKRLPRVMLIVPDLRAMGDGG